MDADERHLRLMRELRRALFIAKQGIEVWKKGEPNKRHVALASGVCACLVILTKAMAAWAGDGEHIPGNAQRLPPPRHRPPVDFTDF